MARPRAADLRIEALAARHDRAAFRCGVESLDGYLHRHAGQDVRRRANAVFVLAESAAPRAIVGYYTLAATALEAGDVPDQARRHIPRYPLVSATLLGRLAVRADRQGEGLGAILLADAIRRTYASAAVIGSTMLVVDAIGERAVGFYEHHGFVRLLDSARLILPMRTIARLL